MTTSGTYTFEPTHASFMDEAFERIGKDPAKLGVRHVRSARRSLSLMFAEWPNKGVALWTVDEQTQTVTDGDPTYNAATGTIAILDMIVRRSDNDTPVHPMSRSDYAAIPDKTSEGLPTRFYFENIATPQYTLWQTPENSTDAIHYWRIRRLQDVGLPTATLDVTSRWFEAVAAGLAAKLALKFAPRRHKDLAILAEVAFETAKLQERERGDLSFELG